MITYDKGFSNPNYPTNIIGNHDKIIKEIIYPQLNDNDILVDTTWIRLDEDLAKIINDSKINSKRILCYTGADWDHSFESPGEKPKFKHVFEALNECNVIHIGNRLGDYYFSFWVDFVYTHLDKFEQFDTFELQSPLKHFMCLNRKPHRPRVEIVNSIEENNLDKFGYVSLGGGGPYGNFLTLTTDIVNKDGDSAVGGDVGITNDITSLGHINNWNSHFLNVVTETTVYTDVFITEKTLKPIIGKRPFIVLGDNNIYKLLQDWGFDTFDDLFGTGYNNPDYQKRIDWIIENLKDLSKQENLDKVLQELKPRLEHNYQQFLKVAISNRHKITNLFG